MEISIFFSQKLEELRLQHTAQKEMEAEKSRLAQKADEYKAYKERAYRLGAKTTRLFRCAGRHEEFKFSKIADVPLNAQPGERTQLRIFYSPPLRSEDGVKLTVPETIIKFRLGDETVHTDFYPLVRFSGLGIDYHNPSEPPFPYGKRLEPDAPELAQVDAILTAAEAAKYKLAG